MTGLKLFVDEAVLLGQAIDAVVRLAHTANSAADGVGLESTGHAPSRLVNFCHVDLDGGVVLGGQNPVGSRAFPGDVEVNILASLVLYNVSCRSESSN